MQSENQDMSWPVFIILMFILFLVMKVDWFMYTSDVADLMHLFGKNICRSVRKVMWDVRLVFQVNADFINHFPSRLSFQEDLQDALLSND